MTMMRYRHATPMGKRINDTGLLSARARGARIGGSRAGLMLSWYRIDDEG